MISLAVTLVAARMFAHRLDRLGSRFGFPEALIGLLTAVAADGPEISSALFALIKGEHGVSVGVLVGSNAFNLAAMIGLSGLLAGSVRLSRDTLLLEGLIGGCVTLVGAGVLLGWVAPALATALAMCVLLPYLLLVIAGAQLLSRAGGKDRVLARLAHALGAHALDERPQVRRTDVSRSDDPAHHLLGLIAFDVALIVAGSVGMVQTSLTLASRWGVSAATLGVLILAPLTSMPNAITAIRLGLARRGAALVAETFNSNTINLAAGVILPALFVPVAVSSSTAKLQLGWLVAMTAMCLLLLGQRRGMGRTGAAVVVALYACFVAIQLAGA